MAGSLHHITNLETAVRALHSFHEEIWELHSERAKAFSTFLVSFRGPYAEAYGDFYDDERGELHTHRGALRDLASDLKRDWAKEVNEYNENRYQAALDEKRAFIERQDAQTDQYMAQGWQVVDAVVDGIQDIPLWERAKREVDRPWWDVDADELMETLDRPTVFAQYHSVGGHYSAYKTNTPNETLGVIR